jgi:hypothetical protein
MIRFADSDDRVPEPHRLPVEQALIQAIRAVRPEREHWTVWTHELPTGGARIYDFARGTEAPRSLTLTDVDDANYSALRDAATYFLRRQWPGGLKPV